MCRGLDFSSELFTILSDGERIGTLEVSRGSTGGYRGHYRVEIGGEVAEISVEVEPDRRGHWRRVKIRSAFESWGIRRLWGCYLPEVNRRRRLILLRGFRPIFEEHSPASLEPILALYDPSRGGEQLVPILTSRGLRITATLRQDLVEERELRGGRAILTRWTVEFPSSSLTAITEHGRVVMLEWPEHRSTLLREGYEGLASASSVIEPEAFAREVPRPGFVRIPMRDGCLLAAELYGRLDEGPKPAVLIRTPYGRRLEAIQASYFARRGYVVAVQDVRGRGDSEGEWMPFIHEGLDGYDTIEWIAAQVWSNGRVGMIGGSYLGYVQWATAVERPPHLRAIVPAAAPPDPFRNVPYEGGAFFLAFALWWNDVVEDEATRDISGRRLWGCLTKDYGPASARLPVVDLDEVILGRRCKTWRAWIAHPTDDEYWEPANYLDRLDRVTIPVFHQTGWFDGNSIGAKLAFERLRAAGKARQRLVIGPWDHAGKAHPALGHVNSSASVVNLQAETRAWLDRHLKGDGAPEEARSSARLFVMGADRWLSDEDYPPGATRLEAWYLDGARGVFRPRGGLRRGELPPGRGCRRFTYDPSAPTPDLGIDELESLTPLALVAAHRPLARVRRRPDVLAYESRRLDSPLTVVGPINLVLFASSSAIDTDWHAHLVAITPRHRPWILAHGTLRARFRQSTSRPEWLVPGRVERFEIDLWHTGVTLAAGSHLRLEIASAAFPTFSRNLNTGGHNEVETDWTVAEQAVYHGGTCASHLILPVQPG